MQAIHTKRIPPTNTRGYRYKAESTSLVLTIDANHALSVEENHKAACLALCRKIAAFNAIKYKTDAKNDPWMRPTVCGQLSDGSFAHVFNR